MVTQQRDGLIEFAYFRPGASQVALAGEFNGWRLDAHQMRRDDQGWWRIRLALPAGEYRFKYVVDRSLWEADFAAYGVEMSKVGGWTSVLYVAATQTLPIAAAA
ncbi:MAG: early set domain-containing protein [Phycisphaerales bacterium]